jgi:glyoxylase-like metal-dependent hydrolase (beta-lactamase superfamily II)
VRLALARAECQSSRVSEFALGPWQQLRPGIYRAVAEPESVNLGLVVGAAAALLVDTGSSPEQGRVIRESVAAVTDRPLVAVVVTHWHCDHAFGLAAYADLDTVGHESVPARLTTPEAADEAARLGVPPEALLPPSRLLVVATAFDLGDRRVEVAHLGRGHTDGDLVVVVPGADLVFTGDLIESAGPPSFGTDSVPDEWAGTLDGLVGLMTERTIAVPGHGDPVDRAFVFNQRGEVAAQAAGQTPVVLPNRPPLPLA